MPNVISIETRNAWQSPAVARQALPKCVTVPNFAVIVKPLLRYGDLLIFQDAGRRHLGFFMFSKFLRVGRVNRVKMRRRDKFRSIIESVAQIWRFFNFKDVGRPPSWLFKRSEF